MIRISGLSASLVCTATFILASANSFAATHCVDPSGSGGCSKTISAAVAAAAPGDTIRVNPGIYKEGVVIGKSLSVVATNQNNTVVDASGQANGFYVDGIDTPNLRNVTITGFTVKNANFEGILVANASSVTVLGNRVTHNDKALDFSAASCPGIPVWETAEGFDCGEGIHLSGVRNSIVTNNDVYENAGGILLSDDTGATHDNVISDNTVLKNSYDCGITLASHPPAALTGSATPLGVYRNTIDGNESSFNGLATDGEGAGVGIFDSIPGTANYANVVTHNKLIGNGMPGVAMHGHTPGQNLTNNVIVGNYIARNQADADDAATPGTTGINVFSVSPATGTVISQNVIEHEQNAVVVNTPAQVDVHLNTFFEHEVGVNNIGPGSADATENWWGCPQGPGHEECASVNGPNVWFNPWLTRPYHNH